VTIDSRIEELVAEANGLDMPEAPLEAFALCVALAERLSADSRDLASKKDGTAERSGKTRLAEHRLHQSAEGARSALLHTFFVFLDYLSELGPKTKTKLRLLYPAFRALGTLIKTIEMEAEDRARKRPKVPKIRKPRTPSRNRLALELWRLLPPYRGYRKHMYALAKLWKITGATEENFFRILYDIPISKR
jgi:hypothetical protein